MDAVDRIFELVGEKFKEQKEFASALRVNDKTVSAWRTRRAKSYTKYLPQIAEALGTTTEYLLTGEGPQKRGPRPVVSDSDTAFLIPAYHPRSLRRHAAGSWRGRPR